MSSRLLAAAALLVAASAASGSTIDVLVVDQADAPVGEAVVYATGTATGTARSAVTGRVAQREKAFHPAVTVVQAGTAIEFPNEDTVRHHVYSFSPAKVFELRLYVGTPPAPVVFDKAGIVVLGCNIHDAMVAYIVVVDTPHFAKTDASGRARLAALPHGDYVVRAWHPRLQAARDLPAAGQGARVPGAPLTVKLVLTPDNARRGHAH